jgi:uncharacterized protein YdiU (UPF0061 family)
LHQNKVPGRIKSILLGEVIDRAGVRRDIQLKEAGPTPYSRRGDGRAALGPVRREYIVSEAIGGARDSDDWGACRSDHRRAGLAQNSFARRCSDSRRIEPRPGRHLPVFAARRDVDAVRRLADHVIARHYPGAESAANPIALLDQVISRQADLIAKWLLVGFIHGVMNTDNMSIAGETIGAR